MTCINTARDTSVAWLEEDVNGDCAVNILDEALTGYAFVSLASSSNWIPEDDLNNDGAVNVLDLAPNGLRLGKTCT